MIEKYYFYRLYSIDLDTVKHSLCIIKRYRRKDVRYCLLRDIVVSYSRPFSGNKGVAWKNHTLKKKEVVPKHLRTLHDDLFNARNQLFAHTDFTYRRPKVAKWRMLGRKWFPMAFRGYDYDKLDARVTEIETLVKSVAENLQTEINKMEESFPNHGNPL